MPRRCTSIPLDGRIDDAVACLSLELLGLLGLDLHHAVRGRFDSTSRTCVSTTATASMIHA